jgi:hypothetical protein
MTDLDNNKKGERRVQGDAIELQESWNASWRVNLTRYRR